MSRCPPSLLERFLYVERRATRPVRSHRLYHVRDREDARLDKYLFAFQHGRVARAVHPLVVLQDCAGDRPWKVDPLDDLAVHARVRLDYPELELAEAAGLAQYLPGDDNLAGVVEDAGDAHALDLVVGQAQLPGDGSGQLRHALLVARGVRVASLRPTAARPCANIDTSGSRQEVGCREAGGAAHR